MHHTVSKLIKLDKSLKTHKAMCDISKHVRKQKKKSFMKNKYLEKNDIRKVLLLTNVSTTYISE